MQENQNKDAYLEELRFEFSKWKRENRISSLLFKYLRETSDHATTSLLSLANWAAPSDQKLASLYYLTAKIEVINEILNLDLEDIVKGEKQDVEI